MLIDTYRLRDDPKSVVILAVFAVVYAVLLIGDNNVRIAWIHTDNGPVAYAHLFANPERFASDVIGQYGKRWAMGSITLWLPAILHPYVPYSLEAMNYLLMFIQAALLPFAFFRLAMVMTGRREVAFMTVFFACAVWPWGWNLASYGALFQMPFYTTLMMSLLVFAGAALIEKRAGQFMLLVVIGALIHPAIILYLLLAAAIYLTLLWRREGPSPVLRWLGLAVALGVVIAVTLPLLNRAAFDGPLMTPAQHWFAISRHMHSFPWSQYPPVWERAWPSFAAFAALLALSLVAQPRLDRPRRDFLVSVTVAVLLFALLHLTGVFIESPLLVQPTGLRATKLMVLFGLPLCIQWLVDRGQARAFGIRWAALLVLLFWPMAEFGAFWFPLGLLAVSEYFSRRVPGSTADRLLGNGTILAAGLVVAGVFLYLRPDQAAGIFFPGAHPSNISIFALILATGVLAMAIRYVSPGSQDVRSISESRTPSSGAASFGTPAVWLTVILAIFAVQKALVFGNESRSEPARALYDAQRWARDHTAPSARFITTESWRSVSQRAAVIAMPDYTMLIYTPIKRLWDVDEALLDLYGMKHEASGMTVFDINNRAYRAFSELSTEGLRQLAQRFPAEYVVRTTQMKPLELPVAYRNNHYIIYSLSVPG